MKKNYFIAVLEEEFLWLKRAVSSDFSLSAAECEKTCRNRHEALVLRLFRDFMTPFERRNLYGISLGILEMFPRLRRVGVFSEGEKDLFLRTADLFLPLPLDERVISLREEFDRMWENPLVSRNFSLCREGFAELFRLVTVAALDHA